MRQILTLLSGDYWELRRWFQHERLSKLFVAIGFVGIIALISTVLYGATGIFFRGLARYETYGLLSAHYVFHAGFIVLFGLITVLSTVSFCTFLFASKRKMSSLLVLPLPSYVIPGWLFFREMTVSLLFFLFFLTPFFLSYYRYFVRTDMLLYIFSYGAVLFIIATLTPLLGMGLGLLVCMAFQKNKKVTLGILVLLFSLGGYLLFQLIFPPQLKTLYNATPQQFETTYHALPLSSVYLPTYWLVKGITEGNIFSVLPFLSSTLMLCILVGSFAARNFSRIYPLLFDRPFQKASAQLFDTRLLTTKWPLMYKDILSITRISQEAGYALLLIALTFVFFLFLLFARQFRSETYEGSSMFVVFYFVAFLFYTIAYALRMIFPLMAKEGRATWHIFSLPLSREGLLTNKLYASFVLILPYIFGSFTLWMIVAAFDGVMIGMYVVLVLCSIVITAVSLGAIHPNFAESENAEKISTSGMGVLTLLVLLIITGVGGFFLHLSITHQQPVWIMFLPTFCLLGGSLLLYSLAKKAVSHYQF